PPPVLTGSGSSGVISAASRHPGQERLAGSRLTLNRMRQALDELFRRRFVIEILAAFAVAYAGVAFLSAVVSGFIVSPIDNPAGDFDGHDAGSVTIAGRVFNWVTPFEWLLIFACVLLILGFMVRRTQEVARPAD